MVYFIISVVIIETFLVYLNADGPIQCQKCFMVCSGPSSLASHNKFRCQINNEHHLWRCIHCDRSFKTQSNLHMHKNIHKGLKPYACRICGNVFSHPRSRDRHYRLHFIQTCSCMMCGKVFGDTISLGRHEKAFHSFKRHSNGKFECVECHKLFANWNSLRRHKKRVLHANADAFECKTCGKLFLKRSNLLRHEALHKPSGLFKCQQCGLCFMSGKCLSDHHLNKHVKEWKSDKEGKCQKMASNTLQKGTAYSARHVCDICQARFSHSCTLAKHIRTKHPKVKIIKCGKCSKVCVDKRRLALHIAIRHTSKDGSKPHSKKQGQVGPQLVGQEHSTAELVKCRQCNRTFSEYQLRNHICIHQKSKVNTGATVQKSKSRRAMNHLRDQKANINKQFRCEFCSKSFPSSSLMHCHRASHFRKNSPALPFSSVISPTALTTESPSFNGTERSKGKVRCEFCYKEFPSKQLMHCHRASHFRTKDQAREVSCERCNRSFHSNESLRQHKCYHARKATISSQSSFKCAENSTYRCNVCNKSFVKETSLRSHMTHHSRNSFKSNVPQSIPLPKCSPKSPRLQAGKHSFKCDICARTFISKASLKSHKSHHSRFGSKLLTSSKPLEPRQVSFTSPVPGSKANVSEESNLNTKQKADINVQQSCECEVCHKSFQSVRSLSQHKRVHAAMNTALICSFCGKRFSSKFTLLRHKQCQHDRPYKCQRCGERFRTDLGRLRHLMYKHGTAETSKTKVKGGQFRIRCLHCDKRFMTRNGRYKHMRKCHTEQSSVGPWKCQHYKNEFQNVSGMRKHLNKRHTKEKKSEPYKGCEPGGEVGLKTINSDVADKTQTCLKSAKFGHWKCQYCSKEFQSYSGVRKHLRKKHGKKTGSVAYQGYKPGWKDGVEPVGSTVDEKTQTAKIPPWKCQYCSKEFQSDSGIKKHIKKKHAKKKRFDPLQVNNLEGVIETTIGEVAEKTQTSSKSAKCAPWKCEYCSKEFLSDSGMKKHIKKKHAKRKRSDSNREDKLKGKGRAEATSNEMAKETQVCRRCQARFFPFGSGDKHMYCFNCSRESALEEGSGFKEQFFGNCIRGRLQSIGKKAKDLNSARAFRCQYCLKGLSSINSLYKHILIAHKTDVGLTSQGSYNRFEKQTVRKNISANQASTTKASGEVIQNSDERNKLASDLNGQQGGVKFKTVENKLCKTRTKRTSVSGLHCRYCRKRFSSKTSRWRHEVKFHGKQVGTSSLRSKLYVDENGTKKPLNENPLLSDDDLAALKNCEEVSRARTVGPDAEEYHSGNTSFPCEYCPKQFLRISSRYKHVMLVHTRAANSSSKGSQSKQKVLTERYTERTGKAMLFSNDHSTCSSATPAKRKTTMSSSDYQPECKKFRRHDNNLELSIDGRPSSQSCVMSDDHSAQTLSGRKAFPCEFCHKTFSTFSLQCKHFFLVHSGSQVLAREGLMDSKSKLANKGPERPESLLSVRSNDFGNPAGQQDFTSQSAVLKYCIPATGSGSNVSSIPGPATEPSKCGICYKTLRTRGQWAEHFEEVHSGKADEATRRSFSRLSRPPLRTISSSLQNSNRLQSLRNRRESDAKGTYNKQVKVSSTCRSKFANSKSSVPTIQSRTNLTKKRFQCDICFSLFSARHSVSRHKQSRHSDVKPFQCTICGFATKRKDLLSIHERLHIT